ncbi:hypothetical protein T10_11471 [Trichinella papuae]|uniref:Uncharacterized protein n=1 Tax=Trichinella papuae TaxID=268474 RepID=A0A0V1MHD7_9BILA|nr:hypothetical protein T10_11471 [Trichinella papuae]
MQMTLIENIRKLKQTISLEFMRQLNQHYITVKYIGDVNVNVNAKCCSECYIIITSSQTKLTQLDNSGEIALIALNTNEHRDIGTQRIEVKTRPNCFQENRLRLYIHSDISFVTRK